MIEAIRADEIVNEVKLISWKRFLGRQKLSSLFFQPYDLYKVEQMATNRYKIYSHMSLTNLFTHEFEEKKNKQVLKYL